MTSHFTAQAFSPKPDEAGPGAARGAEPAAPSLVAELRADPRLAVELRGCIDCGVCTAACPPAGYVAFSPRAIVQALLREDEGFLRAADLAPCVQCYVCSARCPLRTSPAGLVALLRGVAVRRRPGEGGGP